MFLCACATLPADVDRRPSQALPTAAGPLAVIFDRAAERTSGFELLPAGSDAFTLRRALARLATATLDLQYYIWEDDLTGRALLLDVMRAAERGVRVRLLIDDMHTEGASDLFAVVGAHPQIEVRLFNPFPRNRIRMTGLLIEGAHLNHRMHNKALIADNAVAITGGRNIGDHYFAVDESMNFRDLDLLAAGPVVRDLSEMFDAYWNSRWAYPVDALQEAHYTAADAHAHREFLAGWLDAQSEFPFPAPDASSARERLRTIAAGLLPGNARAVFDSPAKVEGDGGLNVAALLFDTADGAARELLIETAYLVPGASGVDILGSLVERGVTVKILTNSLATNDIVAAHAGYMAYREDLLRRGVELYELRPDALEEKRRRELLGAASIATLHTKALVYDRRAVFIGSFNLDPRSLLINTEMGVLIEGEALAERVARMIEEGLKPSNSYRVVLADGDVRWVLGGPDGAEILDTEPHTSWWDRFVASVLSLLPIKEQL